MATSETQKSDGRQEFDSQRERLYRSLKSDLINGVYDLGEKLSETQLGAKYGVSKTPAREALALLQQEGLVEQLPRAGYLASRLTIRGVENIFDLREILEGVGAERAAVEIDEDALLKLEGLSTGYDGEDPNSFRSFLQNNTDFHRLIAESSGNPLLAKTLVPLLEQTQRLLILRAKEKSDGARMIHDHQEIIAALRRRDSAAARKMMVQSIVVSRQAILQTLMHRVSNWHI